MCIRDSGYTGKRNRGLISPNRKEGVNMRKTTKRLLAGGLVLVAAAGIGWNVIKSMEQPAQYENRPTISAEHPETGDIILYTDLTGTVEPRSRA